MCDVEEVSNMLLGQSIDLHTTYLTECPTEAEYLDIVDNSSFPNQMLLIRH